MSSSMPLPNFLLVPLSPQCIFMVALVLSAKFVQDKCYSNKVWAQCNLYATAKPPVPSLHFHGCIGIISKICSRQMLFQQSVGQTLCPQRTFMDALVLSAKFVQDNCYSNKVWARCHPLCRCQITCWCLCPLSAFSWLHWYYQLNLFKTSVLPDPTKW